MGHDPQPRSSGRPLVALVGALLSLAFFFLARPSDAPLALLVQVQPSNARVRVLHPGVAWTGSDEVEARGGEARFVDVPRGAGVRIVVAAPGFQPESQAVSLARRGEEQRVMFALRPETAALSVTSVPAGASLFLDGKEVGVAPLLVSSLVPGVHRLRATIAGHEDTTVDFTVIADEQREILLSLPPTQPSSEPAALPVSSTQDEPPAGRARLRLRSTHTSRFLVGDFVLATGLETYVDVVPGQHRVG
ncbi:MAG: PEGA domain-containing protein, partial [Myxococcota bacterium]